MEFTIWAEKYRPKSLEEMINQKHVVERLKAFVKDKNVPHCLLAGRPGTGKTAVSLALANELYGDGWRQNVLELNSSDERGIAVVRGKIKDFARMKSIGKVPFKLVILDEADALTSDAQHALRRTMENFAKTARFFLICNYSSKIIEPIQSRCSVFRFKPLLEEDIKSFIKRIGDGEKLDISDDAVKAIIYLSEGDLRKVANLLQASASLGKKITENVVYEASSQAKPKEVKEMIDQVLKGNFPNARKMLHQIILVDGVAGEDVIKEVHKQIFDLDIPDEKKVELIEKAGEYDFRISEGADPLVQLTAFLAQFLVHGKK